MSAVKGSLPDKKTEGNSKTKSRKKNRKDKKRNKGSGSKGVKGAGEVQLGSNGQPGGDG